MYIQVYELESWIIWGITLFYLHSAEVTKIENDVINNEPDLLQKDVVNNNVHSGDDVLIDK